MLVNNFPGHVRIDQRALFSPLVSLCAFSLFPNKKEGSTIYATNLYGEKREVRKKMNTGKEIYAAAICLCLRACINKLPRYGFPSVFFARVLCAVAARDFFLPDGKSAKNIFRFFFFFLLGTKMFIGLSKCRVQ